MYKIHVQGDKYAYVDDEFKHLAQYKWHLHGRRYAIRHEKSKTIFMHHDIVGRVEGLVVDHINRNGLDNQTKNLRHVTQSVNMQNVDKLSTNTSGYRGVSWCKLNKKWRAQASINKKVTYLGLFKTPQEAAEAYKRRTTCTV